MLTFLFHSFTTESLTCILFRSFTIYSCASYPKAVTTRVSPLVMPSRLNVPNRFVVISLFRNLDLTFALFNCLPNISVTSPPAVVLFSFCENAATDDVSMTSRKSLNLVFIKFSITFLWISIRDFEPVFLCSCQSQLVGLDRDPSGVSTFLPGRHTAETNISWLHHHTKP